MKKMDATRISEELGKQGESLTPRAVRKRAQVEGWPFDEEPARGGRKRLYLVDQIPNDDIRYKLIGALTKTDKKAEVDRFGLPLGLQVENIPDEFIQTGRARLELVRTMESERAIAIRKGIRIRKAHEAWIERYNNGEMLQTQHEVIGEVKLKSLYQWRTWIKRENWDALCGYKRPHNKGKSYLTVEIKQCLLDKYLHPNKRPKLQVARQVKEDLRDRGISTPSLKTMTRFLDRAERKHLDQMTFLRRGEKELKDGMAPYIIRDWSKIEVGDVLVGDGHRCNFLVVDPYSSPNNPRAIRPILLGFQDMASRLLCGWNFMVNENTQAVHTALFNSIMALGKKPRTVLLDNGKAFKNKFFTGELSGDWRELGFRGLYGLMGIDAHFAEAYNAKAKPVEPWFKAFKEFEQWLSSYTGSSPEDKPATMKRNEEALSVLYERRVFTIDEIQERFIWWLRYRWAQREHSGLDGRTPWEVFVAGRGPGIDINRMAYDMLARKRCAVRNSMITLFKNKYYHPELMRLGGYVEVRYMLQDLRHVYLFEDGGRHYLGKAMMVEPVHGMYVLSGNPIDQEKVKRLNAEHARLLKASKTRAKTLKKMVAAGAEGLVFDETNIPSLSEGCLFEELQPTHVDTGGWLIQQAYEMVSDEVKYNRPFVQTHEVSSSPDHPQALPALPEDGDGESSSQPEEESPEINPTPEKTKKKTQELAEDPAPTDPDDRFDWCMNKLKKEGRKLTNEDKKLMQYALQRSYMREWYEEKYPEILDEEFWNG